MAMKQAIPVVARDEEAIIWPSQMPEPAGMKAVYGADADELVVRFFPDRTYGLVVVDPVADPHDYAALMVDDETQAVIGVQVYPLLAFAVEQHPGWAALAAEDPQLSAIADIVADIRALYERHGLAPPIDS
jgi:hypothetical protein